MANRRTARKNPDTTEETPDGNEASAKLTSATISEENESHAREMGIVKYQEHKVMFIPDFSIAVRKQRKQFDDVKKRLQVLNVCVSSQTELHA
ncbi:hypothetical protein QQF64_018522 [Cirrhinus molitorella]|uniref:Uncharacterized protein n=1 Tax=Cirrhinus molitorella TaxID=172907 RepID=A0ABR3LF77_9TELE